MQLFCNWNLILQMFTKDFRRYPVYTAYNLESGYPRMPQISCLWGISAYHCTESESRSVMSDSLQPHGLCSPWNSLGQNTGVRSLSLLQGIFPTQGSNPGLLHCQLSLKGSPRMMERVAYPFSSGSSWPRNLTRVSCIAGRFFMNWAIREANFKWACPK